MGLIIRVYRRDINMGLKRVVSIVLVCVLLFGCSRDKRILDIEIGKYSSDRIEYDYLYRIEKCDVDKVVYQSYNPLRIDTIMNAGKSVLYVVNEDIEDQELTNKYIVYDFDNDKLYESDMNICLDIINSERGFKELYHRLGKDYCWGVSSISEDLSHIVVTYFNDQQNLLKLYPVD